jgi:hypothetical protein
MILLVLVLVGGVLGAGYAWSQRQYYVAADGPQVAIFKGVQVDLPGIELSSLHEVDDLKVDELSPFNQDKVEAGIVADDLADAERIVQNLADDVADCPEPDTSDGGSSTATSPGEPTATGSAEPRSSGEEGGRRPGDRAGDRSGDRPGDRRASGSTATPAPDSTPSPTASPTGSPTPSPQDECPDGVS